MKRNLEMNLNLVVRLIEILRGANFNGNKVLGKYFQTNDTII